MRQQAVGEGQHGVDPIQGGPTVASVKEEGFLPIQDHLIEYAKICGCTHALQAAKSIRVRHLRNLGKKSLQFLTGAGQRFPIHAHSVIPAGSLDAPAGIVQLAEDHVPGDAAASFRVVRNAVLLPAEQDISAVLSADPRQKAAPGGAEGQADALLRAGAHQRRGRAGVGEADDAL